MAKVNNFRSTTAGNVPSSLDDGAIAINVADGILFWKDSTSAIRKTRISHAITTGTFAASYVWNINTNPNLRLVITANITVSITGTPLDGFVYNLTLEQGGTGSYTATFSSAFVMRNNSSLQFAQNIGLPLGSFTVMSFYGQSGKMAG